MYLGERDACQEHEARRTGHGAGEGPVIERRSELFGEKGGANHLLPPLPFPLILREQASAACLKCAAVLDARVGQLSWKPRRSDALHVGLAMARPVLLPSPVLPFLVMVLLDTSWPWAIGIGALVACFAVAFLLQTSVAVWKSGGAEREVTLTWDSNGVTVVDGHGRAQYGWGAIHSVRNRRAGLTIWVPAFPTGRFPLVMVPRRVLSDQQAAEIVAAWTTGACPPAAAAAPGILYTPTQVDWQSLWSRAAVRPYSPAGAWVSLAILAVAAVFVALSSWQGALLVTALVGLGGLVRWLHRREPSSARRRALFTPAALVWDGAGIRATSSCWDLEVPWSSVVDAYATATTLVLVTSQAHGRAWSGLPIPLNALPAGAAADIRARVAAAARTGNGVGPQVPGGPGLASTGAP